MRNHSDLIAQMPRIMGGATFVLGLIALAVALTFGISTHHLEPFRAVGYCSMIAIMLGGVVWLNSSFSRRLEQLENHLPLSSANGEDKTVSLIRGRRF